MSEFTHGARVALHQLFFNGPTSDGDLITKQGRDELVQFGYCQRAEGWNFIAHDGVTLAIDAGWASYKELGKRCEP